MITMAGTVINIHVKSRITCTGVSPWLINTVMFLVATRHSGHTFIDVKTGLVVFIQVIAYVTFTAMPSFVIDTLLLTAAIVVFTFIDIGTSDSIRH